MASRFMQLMLTPAVQAAQDRYFGRHQAAANAPAREEFTEDEAAFIAERDSFYLSTINSDGWPYIQHRGGPAGFLKVLGPHSLGFADLKGNRQLLTSGNLAGNDRVALFLMDASETARSCFLAPGPATRKPKTRPNQREKPKTALTAARGFCKLRKSWSKVRFRSETKPRRRRSAPGPENQIPIPG
jgi:predicted pyridoxine 5'-phosphate oxidase superfamily flavin-nucleotide-binding protein